MRRSAKQQTALWGLRCGRDGEVEAGRLEETRRPLEIGMLEDDGIRTTGASSGPLTHSRGPTSASDQGPPKSCCEAQKTAMGPEYGQEHSSPGAKNTTSLRKQLLDILESDEDNREAVAVLNRVVDKTGAETVQVKHDMVKSMHERWANMEKAAQGRGSNGCET